MTTEGEPARPAPLPAPTPLAPSSIATRLDLGSARRATLTFAGSEGLTLNGSLSPDPQPILRARRGDTLAFQFENRTSLPIVVHVPGHHLRPLDGLDDGWKPWLLDTVLVDPGGRLIAACRAEFTGSWKIEAHTASPRPRQTEAVFEVA